MLTIPRIEMGDTLCPTCPAADMTFPVRERFFTARLRFKTLDELNAWLLDKCIAYAKAHHHPELTEQTVWGRSSFPMPAVSTDSMRCRHRSRRPALVRFNCRGVVRDARVGIAGHARRSIVRNPRDWRGGVGGETRRRIM